MRDVPRGSVDTETVTKALAGALVLTLLVVVVFATTPIGSGDPYTEFYVLGSNGTASGYPENVTVNEPASVRVGIGNFENHRTTYTLVARTNETALATRTMTLGRGEEWTDSIPLAFDSPGRKRLRLELYAGETTDGRPYRRLWLFVDVARNASTPPDG